LDDEQDTGDRLMFITSERSSPRGWYSRSGQHASGSFLMLFNRDPGGEVRALVRHVRMDQLGQFMMSSVVVDGVRITLSGCYGSDGLPIGVDHPKPCRWDPKALLWDRLHVLPEHLTKALWSGKGWNSCGEEGPAIRKWASENCTHLRRLR
jgi:hypothetical protein